MIRCAGGGHRIRLKPLKVSVIKPRLRGPRAIRGSNARIEAKRASHAREIAPDRRERGMEAHDQIGAGPPPPGLPPPPPIGATPPPPERPTPPPIMVRIVLRARVCR